MGRKRKIELFIPEKVLDVRLRNGIDEYKIKWQGYGLADASWERPETMYPDTPHPRNTTYWKNLLIEFKFAHPKVWKRHELEMARQLRPTKAKETQPPRTSQAEGEKRGRGRPRKLVSAPSNLPEKDDATVAAAPKRGHGRPRKINPDSHAQARARTPRQAPVSPALKPQSSASTPTKRHTNNSFAAMLAMSDPESGDADDAIIENSVDGNQHQPSTLKETNTPADSDVDTANQDSSVEVIPDSCDETPGPGNAGNDTAMRVPSPGSDVEQSQAVDPASPAYSQPVADSEQGTCDRLPVDIESVGDKDQSVADNDQLIEENGQSAGDNGQPVGDNNQSVEDNEQPAGDIDRSVGDIHHSVEDDDHSIGDNDQSVAGGDRLADAVTVTDSDAIADSHPPVERDEVDTPTTADTAVTPQPTVSGTADASAGATATPAPVKRGRGRPRKYPLPGAPNSPSAPLPVVDAVSNTTKSAQSESTTTSSGVHANASSTQPKQARSVKPRPLQRATKRKASVDSASPETDNPAPNGRNVASHQFTSRSSPTIDTHSKPHYDAVSDMYRAVERPYHTPHPGYRPMTPGPPRMYMESSGYGYSSPGWAHPPPMRPRAPPPVSIGPPPHKYSVHSQGPNNSVGPYLEHGYRPVVGSRLPHQYTHDAVPQHRGYPTGPYRGAFPAEEMYSPHVRRFQASEPFPRALKTLAPRQALDAMDAPSPHHLAVGGERESDRDSRAGSVHSPRMPGNGRSLTPATAYSDPRVNARPSLSETSVKRARYADGEYSGSPRIEGAGYSQLGPRTSADIGARGVISSPYLERDRDSDGPWVAMPNRKPQRDPRHYYDGPYYAP